MELPKLPQTYFTEQAGVLAFATAINSKNLIWRKTESADVGIDGQVEYLDHDGRCTGKIVAVQVKSGMSYIDSGDSDAITFRPESKHLAYWRDFPIPVLLVIHDTDTIHWVDARQQLRSGGAANGVIRIPRNEPLTLEDRDALFATSGPLGGKVLAVNEVVLELAKNRSQSKVISLTFMDLFVIGLIDICRKVFFTMALVMDVIEFRTAHDPDLGYGIGSEEHQFADDYIKFLVSQNLVYYDYSDYLIDKEKHHIQPVFICTLTERGRAVKAALRKLRGGDAVRESIVGIIQAHGYVPDFSGRLSAVDSMRAELRQV